MPLRHIDDPDRLRHLVDAVLSVGSDLSLPDALRRIVEAAVSSVDARYGALGVLDAARCPGRAIRQIRSTIFSRQAPRRPGRRLRATPSVVGIAEVWLS